MVSVTIESLVTLWLLLGFCVGTVIGYFLGRVSR